MCVCVGGVRAQAAYLLLSNHVKANYILAVVVLYHSAGEGQTDKKYF